MSGRLIVACFGLLVGLSYVHIAADAASPSLVEAEIHQALDASAAQWSTGKLDQFMALYDDSPETTFIGGDKIISGYQAIHDIYAAHYGTGDAKAMGKLRIDMLHFRQIDPTTALTIIRYHLLKDGAASEATGLSTLIFSKTSQGWRIISDHSD